MREEVKKPFNRKKVKSYKIRAVERQSWDSKEDSSSEETHVLFIKGKDDRVLININGRKIKMVADTGCGQNIISSQLYREQFKRCPLKHTDKKFVAYGQQYPLKCLGYFEASLTTGMNCIEERIYVIEGRAESLLGRQCCFDQGLLKQVTFMNDDNASTKVHSDKLDLLVREYDDLFWGLGNTTNFTYTISIDPNVKAVSQPLR